MPRSIVCTHRGLHEALKASLDGSQIELSYTKFDPILDALIESYTAGMERFAESASTDDSPGGEYDRVRALDSRVTEALIEKLGEGGRDPYRRSRKYFGREVSDDENILRDMAYFEWLMFDDRLTHRSKTVAEKLKADKAKLTPPERAILAARMKASPRFYRVDAVVPGVSATVADIENGESFGLRIAVSPAPHRSQPSWLRASIAPVPSISFPSRVPAQRLHLRPSDRSPRSLQPHRPIRSGPASPSAGHALEREYDAPELTNSDGEKLNPQELIFSLDDPAAFEKALRQSDDIDIDDDGVIRWLKDARDGWPGDRVTAANLEIIHDQLYVEVNSLERAEDAQAWLETLPGVTFELMQDAESDEESIDASLPQLGVAPNAEVVEEFLQQIMDKQHRNWLDESIPALDGLTPRQAWADPEGQRRVRRMINTMPDAQGPGGLRVPPDRDALFEELNG